ncbi:neuropeptide Y receptor type 1 [Onthophagus taurus]|uniref:neuropeptide Y receptor type 1 n=1 Tax=Onthophagus taurus TaxID=166361 RepID=UPI000C20824C|nr:substance-P receptor [Onthophagus taurus]
MNRFNNQGNKSSGVSLNSDYENSVMIDISNSTFINEIWLVTDTREIIIKTSAVLPVVLWGIFGNICLLYIIIKFRHLRSPTNLLIGNMAAADLASLLIHPWVVLVYDFFQNYQLGAFGCKVEAAIESAILMTSVINLSAISYDRLTAIVLPKETRLTRKGTKILMGITWIVGLIIASPLFFYRTYKERQWLDFLEKFCSENTIVINIYWHVIITILFWFPLIIMLLCYISIFIKLTKYDKVMKQQLKPSRTISYKTKAIKTMFIVVVTFMICRLPFTALIFYRNYLLKSNSISSQVQNQANGNYETLWFVSKYLVFVNAAINPVIYGLTNEKFRRALKSTGVAKFLFNFSKIERKMCYENDRHRIINEEEEPKKIFTKETVLNYSNRIFVIFKGGRGQKYVPEVDTSQTEIQKYTLK